ncbi:MAG TPA: hypothetical protein VM121_06315 [Acidimicrobiales bacterium]|nr:hypothetical protein [Acidimicrobiales bacterium]
MSPPPEPLAPLVLEVTADKAYQEAVAKASKALLADQQLRQIFQGNDLWLVGFDVIDKVDGNPPRFSTIVHDTATGRSVRAEGAFYDDPEDLGALSITPTAQQQPPTDEEFDWAVETLKNDMDWGKVIFVEGVEAYRPSPALANIGYPDGSVERVITVGLRSEAGDGPRHRIMGVKTWDGKAVPEPTGVPAPSDKECGVRRDPTPPAEETVEGAPRVRVQVRREGEERALWDLVVVRPRASSGTNGSGIELRNVDYKGQSVLHRAHLPIATVEYDEEDRAAAGCAPLERVWLREESGFEATAADGQPDDPIAGFRVCAEAPRTIIDADEEQGQFCGVALRLEGEELVIVSQVKAGWHRYVNEWRLHADGTIRPRMAISAVHNPVTCSPHVHHLYWRFDFDIVGMVNVVQEHNDEPVHGTSSWHTVRFEVARPRNTERGRFWRVRSARSSQGYSLMPGANDDVAGTTGAGDVWVVRYDDSEVDDGVGPSVDPEQAPAQLDWFVTGESAHTADVVLWYAAHAARPGTPAPVGPDLVPFNWKDSSAAEAPFATLEPPPA